MGRTFSAESRVFTSRLPSSSLVITRDLGVLHMSQLCPQGQPPWGKDTRNHHSPSTAVLLEGQTKGTFPGSSCREAEWTCFPRLP